MTVGATAGDEIAGAAEAGVVTAGADVDAGVGACTTTGAGVDATVGTAGGDGGTGCAIAGTLIAGIVEAAGAGAGATKGVGMLVAELSVGG